MKEMLKISVLMYITGVILILLGIHELDLSFNMKGDCIDTSVGGFIKNNIQMHMQGMNEILTGLFFTLCGFIGILPSSDYNGLKNN